MAFDRKAYMKKYNKDYKKKHKKRLNKRNNELQRLFRERNPHMASYGTTKEGRRAYRRNIRLALVNLMGGKCVVCGETDPIYFQIDHVNNDGGGRYRKEHEINTSMYLASPDRFQLMCANCNWAKEKNGGKLYNRNRGDSIQRLMYAKAQVKKLEYELGDKNPFEPTIFARIMATPSEDEKARRFVESLMADKDVFTPAGHATKANKRWKNVNKRKEKK